MKDSLARKKPYSGISANLQTLAAALKLDCHYDKCSTKSGIMTRSLEVNSTDMSRTRDCNDGDTMLLHL